jgi:hypothetical protein
VVRHKAKRLHKSRLLPRPAAGVIVAAGFLFGYF